jgi:hypothetical protein
MVIHTRDSVSRMLLVPDTISQTIEANREKEGSKL